MSFADFKDQQQVVQLLQRSLERGRLGHAYLFTGNALPMLESMAQTLVKTLNCLQPMRSVSTGVAIDCCDACLNCRKIAEFNHSDVQWVRPESKSRAITIDQMRQVMQTIHLKPLEAEYKVAIIVAADRLNVQAANAFLKTLEEPPAKSVFILLSTSPQRLLETIHSRCLRLNFAGDTDSMHTAGQVEWLQAFGEMANGLHHNLIDRYRLLGVLLSRLTQMKGVIEQTLTTRSPLERYEDVEPDLREKWEEELAAAIEAEYRRQRAEVLAHLQGWLRDVWLQTQQLAADRLCYPQFDSATQQTARRLTADAALENLRVLERTQRLLESNVQEALALEVGLLKLNL